MLFEGLGTTVDLCTMRYHVPGGAAAAAGAGGAGGGAGAGLAVGFAVRGRMHADAEPLPELPQRAVAGAAAGVGAAMAWGEQAGGGGAESLSMAERAQQSGELMRFEILPRYESTHCPPPFCIYNFPYICPEPLLADPSFS